MPNKTAMKSFVTDMLKTKLPVHLYYHNRNHTLYVLDKAIEIARHENCTEKEIRLLSAAALWHDTGHIEMYTNHEDISCELAKKYLPDFGYSDEDIKIICGIIMATKIPQSPKNKLEEIIADADLYYLGTESAHINSNLLFKELQYQNKALTEKDWNQTQESFLRNHHYFTTYCKLKIEPAKLAYYKSIIN